jgi:hypothetical protein
MTETLSLDAIIIPLLEEGVEPLTIARALNVDPDYINSLPATRRRRIAAEEEISQGVLQLMTMAMEEGRKLLIEGTPTVKMRFIHSLLGIYIKNFSSEAPKELEEMRDEFLTLIGKQRTIISTEIKEDANVNE